MEPNNRGMRFAFLCVAISIALLVACDRKELQPGERRLQTDLSKNGASALNRSAQRSPTDTSDDLTFYCAAGIRLPIKQIVVDYEREYGVQVQVQYGGSGTLLSNIQTARIGDLYLAADESYIQRAREKKLLVESIPVARMKPVIAVPKDNPQKITSIQDLLRPDIRVALANPEAAAIGRITREILRENQVWNRLKEHTKVFKPTVNDVANDIRLGAVDTGIIWDSIANQYDQIDSISVGEFDQKSYLITIGILSSSRKPTSSLKFARYLSAQDKGLKHFADLGYQPIDEADLWQEHPEILLYSGAMLRPGLQRAIDAFQEREGVMINTVYNGCGILVSQMKAGEKPEAYVSCDISFMEPVQDRFLPPKRLAENDMVILVKKGNHKQIKGLRDLAKPNISVGLAHPEKSALGKLTKVLLKTKGLDQLILKNTKVDSPTGDFLVNQVRAGSLDAVVVYRSNGMSNPDNLAKHLDLIEIRLDLVSEAMTVTAVQTYAIAKDSKHKQLLGRFFEQVLDQESRSVFESFGFRWISKTEHNDG